MADAGSGSGSGSGDGADSAEEDDDEDRVRSQRPVGNSSNRGAPTNHGANYGGPGAGRQPNTKPAVHDPSRKASPAHETKTGGDDGIEFAPAGTTARPEVKTTASSATPADSTQQPLSATKALTRYLVPIVVMWLGNMF